MAHPLPTHDLKRIGQELGFQSVGVTSAEPIPQALDLYGNWLQAGYAAEMDYLHQHQNVKSDPKQLLPSAQSIIALALNYYQPNASDPKIARYALGRDYHKVIPNKLKILTHELTELYGESEYRVCVDSAPILDRSYASLAGLGWFGKNSMLIDSHRGSWFFIALILTSLDFEKDQPSVGGCGQCTRCIDACPTGAIQPMNGRWVVNSGQCISYQTIENKGDLKVDTAGWLFGCDICQEVCPFNQPREHQPLRAAPTEETDFAARNYPPVEKLVRLDEESWDRLTQGSPIRRAGYAGLKRNAQAILESHVPGTRHS